MMLWTISAWIPQKMSIGVRNSTMEKERVGRSFVNR